MQGTVQKLRNTTPIFPIYIYIYSISIYVVKNKHLFHTNHHIHSIHKRFKTNLHPPTANLTKFQNYSAIKIFNKLPHEIKDISYDILPFQNALQEFLLTTSFYIVRNILINRDIALKFKCTISFKHFNAALYL